MVNSHISKMRAHRFLKAPTSLCFGVLSLVLPLALLLPLLSAHAQSRGTESGLLIPRFVSLRSDTVNMRAGPGRRYPIEWVYQRRFLPLEVVNEFRHWRKVRDHEGDMGWIHTSMLSGRRTAIVVGEGVELFPGSEPGVAADAKFGAGVVVRLRECPSVMEMCRVEARGREGWVRRDALWGIRPGEVIE